MSSTVELSKKKLAAAFVALTLVSAGIGAGVTIVTLSVSPISPGAGTLTGSNVLSIESQELQYTGNNVTGVNVTVNNTDTSSHTVDIHVALRNTTSGTVVRETTLSGVTVSAGTAETFTVSLSPSVSTADFDKVEVNVEQTG